MNLALMIIDLQKAFYDDESRHSMDSACEYINAILPVFRKAKLSSTEFTIFPSWSG